MIDKNELDDIFGIPQDGSHLDNDSGSADDVAFGNVVSQNAGTKSFSDQVSSLHKDLFSVAKPLVADTKELDVKETKINNGGVANEFQVNKIRESTSKDGSDTIAINSGSNSKVFTKPTEFVGDDFSVRSTISETQVDAGRDQEKGKNVDFVSINDWNTKTKNLTFISFYDMKKDSLHGWLLPGGEINFIQTQDELVNARVDLSTIEFGDLHSMFDSLKNVQHWKDRVTEISLRVNAQYYSWKRAVELFRGALARMYYEKPAEKQDGVVMEHMGDMLRYYSQIEALHANVDAVTRNLDNAFDCISRQITVSIPYGQKEAETVEKRVSKTMASKPDLSDSFADIVRSADSLPEKTYIPPRMADRDNPVSKKIGTVNWSDI
jgi:hypothetical protein